MRIVAIVNSNSRPRRAVTAALRSALAGHELDIHLTEYPGHATMLARQAADRRADVIVVAGGDGTVGDAANGVIGSDVKLAIVPTGTANDLAAYLGLPASVDEACRLVDSGCSRPIDAVRINGRYVLTTVGFGIGCEAIARAGRIRRAGRQRFHPARILGHRLYSLGYALALADGQGWPRRLIVRQNGLDLDCRALSLTISNVPRLGRSLLIAPQARPDDGLLDICVIEDRGRLGALCAVLRAYRRLSTDTPRVRQWRATRVFIESTEPIPSFGDGELLMPSTHFDVRVVPRAVTIIVPHEREVS